MNTRIHLTSRAVLWVLLLPALALAAEPTSEADAPYIQPSAQFKVMTAKVRGVSATKLVLERFNIERNFKKAETLAGDPSVPVDGEKKAWLELRKGDLVNVTFDPSSQPRRAVKVSVMKPSDHPAVARTVGLQQTNKRGREFSGWIKLKHDDYVVVRTPDEPAPSDRKGTRMRFNRTEETKVTKFRDSWDALKKGDRVTVQYGKGRPRPAERVAVVLRGGEKPLPAGLPTRLYDPKFDDSVKDVDGIGEVAPGEEWRPETAAATKPGDS